MKKAVITAILLSALLTAQTLAAPSNSIVPVESHEEFAQVIPTEEKAHLSFDFQGEGTQTSPYVLTNAEQFNDFASLVNVTDSAYASSYVTLGANIDFEGQKLTPIGIVSSPFTGVFDGNGYVIKNFNLENVNYAGIIGCLYGGTVKNVGAVDVKASINTTGGTFVGAVVGYIDGTVSSDAIVSNCYSSGTIQAESTTGAMAVGGIVGKVMLEKGKAFISDCGSYCDVTAKGRSSAYAGGFLGNISSKSVGYFQISRCFSFGNVESNVSLYYSYAGGFGGYVNQDESGWTDWYGELYADSYNFENCFSAGNVKSHGGSQVNGGAFTGYNNGSNTKYGMCCFGKSQTVEASIIDKTGTATDNSLFASKAFLTDSMCFDMQNIWYLSSDGKIFSRILCKANGAPETMNSASIRTSGSQGIRFGATAFNEMRDYADEYGFIIALEGTLDGRELTFDYGGKYVYGAAYNVKGGKDLIYDINDTGTVFTGVLVNIPESQYQTRITARPYIKYTSQGETKILYGNSVTRSIYEVALAAKNSESFEALSDQAKNVINNIVKSVEQ